MTAGINHYIVLSALIFGFGVYSAISARSRTKTITGISLIFIASLLNIAVFSGFRWFNPEGQIVFIMIAVICLLIVFTGIFISHRASEDKTRSEN